MTTALITHQVSGSEESLEKTFGRFQHNEDSLPEQFILPFPYGDVCSVQGSNDSHAHRRDVLTYGHVYRFRLKACEELPSQCDPLKVDVDPPRNFKLIRRNHLATEMKGV